MYRSALMNRRYAAELVEADTSPLDAAGVAWHYGDPLKEQRAMQFGPVIVDRTHRRVIKVAGPDAAEFLNNLLSQKLDDAPDGFVGAALDLDGQGRILHHMSVQRHDGDFYLDVPSYSGDSLRDYLTKMVFWSQVEVSDTDFGVLTELSPKDAPTTVAQASEERLPTRRVEWAGPGPYRFDTLVQRSALGPVVKAYEGAGAALVGLMAFTSARVQAGEPELRADLDDKSIPHEAHRLIGRGDAIGAVHLEKGCYRGQETVARVDNIGRSPRLMVMLHLDGSAPLEPTTGSDIRLGGRRVGRLGTVVHDCDYGPIALGLVKRSALGGVEAGAAPVELELVAGEEDEITVSAAVDPDSLPADEGEHAGRTAIAKLKAGPQADTPQFD